MKKIVFGADHAGYAYKNILIGIFEGMGYECIDMGTNSDASVDYPEYAGKVCREVQAGADFGILVCGTGIGMSIAANKYHGIRAALCGDTVSAKFTRLHNNANVLCLGARIIGISSAEEIAKTFIATVFEGGRHQRRIDMLEKQ